MDNHYRIILTGRVPANLCHRIMDDFAKSCPRGVVLSSEHPLSRQYKATMVMCHDLDPEADSRKVFRTEVDDLKEQLHRALDDASRRAPVAVLAAVNDLAKSFKEERDLYSGRLAELQVQHDRLRRHADAMAERQDRLRDAVLALEPPTTFRESRRCGLSAEDAVTEEAQAAWEMCRDAVLAMLDSSDRAFTPRGESVISAASAKPEESYCAECRAEVPAVCPECHGAGVVTDREVEADTCVICDGGGTVTIKGLFRHYNALLRDSRTMARLLSERTDERDDLKARCAVYDDAANSHARETSELSTELFRFRAIARQAECAMKANSNAAKAANTEANDLRCRLAGAQSRIVDGIKALPFSINGEEKLIEITGVLAIIDAVLADREDHPNG